MSTGGWVLCLSLASLAAADAQVGGSYRLGNTGGRYEDIYGEPEHWPLADLVGGERPRANKSIWTQGVLMAVGTTVQLCVEDEVRCLRLDRPVAEIADAFYAQARGWSGKPAKVTGAFLVEADLPGGFTFWSFESVDATARPRQASDLPAIEDLVRDPARFEGRTVTLRGCYRGRNWAPASDTPKPDASDAWLLSDDAFHVWVAGRPATGKGFRLDAKDARGGFVVEATGTVKRAGPSAFLDAKAVRLVRRDESGCR